MVRFQLKQHKNFVVLTDSKQDCMNSTQKRWLDFHDCPFSFKTAQNLMFSMEATLDFVI
jgi:hypothetical protein